jgi:hypothetical protein
MDSTLILVFLGYEFEGMVSLTQDRLMNRNVPGAQGLSQSFAARAARF